MDQAQKLPAIVNAIQWDGTNFDQVGRLSYNIFGPYSDDHLEIASPDGRLRAEVDDWIIVGSAGEVLPCKPDIFSKTYEPFTEIGSG